MSGAVTEVEFNWLCPCGATALWHALPAEVNDPASTRIDCQHCLTPPPEEDT